MEWIDAPSVRSPTGARSSPSPSFRASSSSPSFRRSTSPAAARAAGSGSSRVFLPISGPHISADERRALSHDYTPQTSLRRSSSPSSQRSSKPFWQVQDEIEKNEDDSRKREAERRRKFLLEKEDEQGQKVRKAQSEHRRVYLAAQKSYQERRDKQKDAERQAERERVENLNEAIRREESLAMAVASPHVSPVHRRPPISRAL